MLRTVILAACFCALASQSHAEIVRHPRGCPARLFCGCGAAVEIFNAPIRSLWLARAWFRFPRAQPAPGRVAVRRHHVFVLRHHIRDAIWMVYDANSGGAQNAGAPALYRRMDDRGPARGEGGRAMMPAIAVLMVLGFVFAPLAGGPILLVAIVLAMWTGRR